MLIAIYNMLKYNCPYTDLGDTYYLQFNTERKIGYYLKQLDKLGWQVPITA